MILKRSGVYSELSSEPDGVGGLREEKGLTSAVKKAWTMMKSKDPKFADWLKKQNISRIKRKKKK